MLKLTLNVTGKKYVINTEFKSRHFGDYFLHSFASYKSFFKSTRTLSALGLNSFTVRKFLSEVHRRQGFISSN